MNKQMTPAKQGISLSDNAERPLAEAERFTQNVNLFGDIVSRNYLQRLNDCEIIEPESTRNISTVRWYGITKIVLEKDTFFPDKLAMIYVALHKDAKNVVLVINKDNGKIELYLGARDFSGIDNVSGEILKTSLMGYLPGVKLKNRKGIPGNEYAMPCVSCVSGLASLKDDKKEQFVQGIENLINATSEIPSFTAYFIADNVTDDEATSMIAAFNNLHSSLSPLAESQMTFSENETEGTSKTLSENFSKSITKSLSHTVTDTEGYNESQTDTTGTSESKSENRSVSMWHGLSNLIFGGKSGRSESTSTNKSTAHQVGQNSSHAVADQTGESNAEQRGTGVADGVNQSKTVGQTRQITFKNNSVKVYLDTIEAEIRRLQTGIPYGLWSTASYFVAGDPTTVQTLANIYRGCIVGEESSHESYGVNAWSNRSDVSKLLAYLTNTLQPRFLYKGINVSAGSVVTSKELAIHFSLPQSSVPGILVREEQTFGRNIMTSAKLEESNSIHVGYIQHLGEIDEDAEVRLSLKELSKHVFVTGTTGSGKSNTLYLLVSELADRKIKFLVIEPAKGEYKEVFGSREDVAVYGSNPRISNLLTLNPFSFPDDIDIYEHIDSLVEVFSACWPMYAAMPQVLKHSIIEAYKTCGWNLNKSYNPDNIFPTIEDVLDALKEYINSSEYSSDTKGDYKGSLETRLLSLCEGVVGRMFNEAPIPDNKLFNENVIIDLSRVKSTETKSLIMGLLVLKLNEYRISEHLGMNQKLRHVTVIEEAHNLLKRTSTSQSAESSNVAEMAVEKIANSMAEMRTYGEGFIIVDQSPSMLDLAAIRNTNTKIVMALPEREDRETAGKSLGLDDEHIAEISQLKTGEAIVFQSGWEEPVRSKILEYNVESIPWVFERKESNEDYKDPKEDILNLLISCYTSRSREFSRQELLKLLSLANVSGGRVHKIKEKIDSIDNVSIDDIAFIFATVIGSDIFDSAQSIKDIDVFNAQVSRAIAHFLGLKETDSRLKTALNMYIKGCSEKSQDPFYEGWLQLTVKSNNYD